jgi:dehydrogenase/reductase SDR family member 1
LKFKDCQHAAFFWFFVAEVEVVEDNDDERDLYLRSALMIIMMKKYGKQRRTMLVHKRERQVEKKRLTDCFVMMRAFLLVLTAAFSLGVHATSRLTAFAFVLNHPCHNHHHQQEHHSPGVVGGGGCENQRQTHGRSSISSPSRSSSRRSLSSTHLTAKFKWADLDGEQRLKDCVCLVTGASRGLGKGIALELGKQGAIVYVTGTTSSSNTGGGGAANPYASKPGIGGLGTIEETADAVTKAGGTGIAVLCNHAVDADVKRLFQRIEAEQNGRLDILVNNAFRVPEGGAERLSQKFWVHGPEIWDTVHTVGLRSHFIATCYAMPLLLKSRRQQQNNKNNNNNFLPRPLIAMIGSFGGLTYSFNVPYGVGKAGVERMVKDMAIELVDDDICVVSFWPGLVYTERTKELVESGEWEKHVGLPLGQSEYPGFTGRAIVAVACDPDNDKKTGTYQVVAELAEEYGFTDLDGSRPASIRSLRFLLPSYAFDEKTRERIPTSMIPDWKLPFWILAGGKGGKK